MDAFDPVCCQWFKVPPGWNLEDGKICYIHESRGVSVALISPGHWRLFELSHGHWIPANGSRYRKAARAFEAADRLAG